MLQKFLYGPIDDRLIKIILREWRIINLSKF
jgi:hypothetical protein